MALPWYVQRLSPQIDRLFRAGHRAAAPSAAAVRQELGIPTFGLLVDLRKLLLTTCGVTLDQARVVERYADPDGIAAALEEHVGQELLRRQGTSYLPTERGREVLMRLMELLRRAVTSLWTGKEDDVAAAAGLAAAVVGHGATTLPAAGYPAFTAELQGFVPEDAGSAFTLWTHIATLRYLRADAHALAWQEAGLDAEGIVLLTALWSAGESRTAEARTAEALLSVSPHACETEIEATLGSLGRRGWARRSEAGWELTEEGRRVREAIEFATNAYNAPPYRALSPEQRERLISILEGLPGA